MTSPGGQRLLFTVAIASATEQVEITKRDPDFEAERQLEIDQDDQMEVPRLQDRHWGFFLGGVYVDRKTDTRVQKSCTNTTGIPTCKILHFVPVRSFRVNAEDEESELVALALLQAGVPFSQTPDGVLFKRVPIGIPVGPLPPGVDLEDFAYEE